MSTACQFLPYNPAVLIPTHNVKFCAKKKGTFKKKHMWSSIPLPPAHKILTKKVYFKIDQKPWNEPWPHTFCPGKSPLAPSITW